MYSMIFSIFLSFFYLWFQAYRSNQYSFNKKILLWAFSIKLLSVLLSILLYKQAHEDYGILWTSFAFLPTSILLFLIFVGIYISNDYAIYYIDPITSFLSFSYNLDDFKEGLFNMIKCKLKPR